MSARDLSDLAADTSPNHDTSPMLFDSVDVARVARQIENKPNALTKALFGLNPKGISHLLRKLWLAGEKRAAALADLTIKHRDLGWKLEDYQRDSKKITFILDRTIDRWGKNKPGFIFMSEGEFAALDEIYDCPDKIKAGIGVRWAFTYRGFPIWTTRGTVGPFMVSPETFETFKALNFKPLVLVEK
jgi:hypothetical protein